MELTATRDGAKQVKRTAGTRNAHRRFLGVWTIGDREQTTAGTSLTVEFNAWDFDIEAVEETEDQNDMNVYTRDEFFAALSAASRKMAPVDDPRWQRIPRDIVEDGELVDDARQAIEDLHNGETEPM